MLAIFTALALAAQAAPVPPQATQLPPPIPPVPAPVTPAVEADTRPYVALVTDLGTITVRIETGRAPVTAANFLRYVDGGHYDGGVFHRTVKMDNQPESPVKIEVIQAGVNPDRAKNGFPPIALERTSATGLHHQDGAVSMARSAPDSATSGWFICINDQPSLDFGGARNPDGQGFAAFGRVITGMDVVRRIQQAPSSSNRTSNTEAQRLTPPIRITTVSRVVP